MEIKGDEVEKAWIPGLCWIDKVRKGELSGSEAIPATPARQSRDAKRPKAPEVARLRQMQRRLKNLAPGVLSLKNSISVLVLLFTRVTNEPGRLKHLPQLPSRSV